MEDFLLKCKCLKTRDVVSVSYEMLVNEPTASSYEALIFVCIRS